MSTQREFSEITSMFAAKIYSPEERKIYNRVLTWSEILQQYKFKKRNIYEVATTLQWIQDDVREDYEIPFGGKKRQRKIKYEHINININKKPKENLSLFWELIIVKLYASALEWCTQPSPCLGWLHIYRARYDPVGLI